MISLLNGMISLIDIGLNDCYSGFGEWTTGWCEAFEDYYTDDEGITAKLKYLPSSNSATNIVDELSLLLTAGRLGSASKEIITEAYQGENDSSSALRLAQKLILATPEFHSTTVFDKSSSERPDIEQQVSSNRDYKAVSLH